MHLDLKPANILLESGDYSSKLSTRIILIDFGISGRYIDAAGEHSPCRNINAFKGSECFASKNAF